MPSNYASGQTNDWLDYIRTLTGESQPSWGSYLGQVPWWSVQEMERTPTMGYGAYASMGGYGQSPNYSNWLSNQFGKYYDQYKTLGATNPMLFWTDYLNNISPKQDFSFTAPYERGERAGLFAPSMRMVT